MDLLSILKDGKEVVDWAINKYYSKMDTDMYLRQLYFESKLNQELINHIDLEKIQNNQQLPDEIVEILDCFQTKISEGIFYNLKHKVFKRLDDTIWIYEIDEEKGVEKDKTIESSIVNYIRLYVEKISSLKTFGKINKNSYIKNIRFNLRLNNLKKNLEILCIGLSKLPEIKKIMTQKEI